jgi:hypothetical protein
MSGPGRAREQSPVRVRARGRGRRAACALALGGGLGVLLSGAGAAAGSPTAPAPPRDPGPPAAAPPAIPLAAPVPAAGAGIAPAGSEPAPPSAAPRPAISGHRRALAIGAAIAPGLVIRGAGSFVARERPAARALLLLGGLGAAAATAGAAALGASGAQGTVTAIGSPLVVLGVGAFVQSWLGDLWVAAGAARAAGTAQATPPWSLEVGGTWLRDPYRDRGLARSGATVEWGRLRGAAAALLGPGTRTVELAGHVRALGAPAGADPLHDGSRALARATARSYRDEADRFELATVELELAGRLDLRRVHPALAGAFLDLAAGAGAERATYPGGASDLDAVMLLGFAWGAYLGDRGAARVRYQHRRDDLAGGIYAQRASGFLGSVAGDAEVRIAGRWGARAELIVGNAWVTTVALQYRGGGGSRR